MKRYLLSFFLVSAVSVQPVLCAETGVFGLAALEPIEPAVKGMGLIEVAQTPSIREPGIALRLAINTVWQKVSTAQNLLSFADNIAELETIFQETVAGNDIFRAAYKGAEVLKNMGVAVEKGKKTYDLIAELYDNYLTYSNLAGRITTYYEDLSRNGINSANRAATVLHNTLAITDVLKDELDFVEAMLKMDKSFTLDKKADYVRDMSQKYRNHAALLNAMWGNDVENADRIRNAIASLDVFTDFVYGNPSDDPDGIRLFGDPDWSSVIRPIKVNRNVVYEKAENGGGSGEKSSSVTYEMPKVNTPDETTGWLYKVGGNVLDLMSVLIVILGVLYTAVNFIRQGKGDKQEQHQDALLKVIVGCLGSIAILQLFRLMFY